MIYLIVACDKNNLIGKKDSANGMPWSNKEDLAHFKKTTINKTIVMGKTTFEAIGRPLPKRKTVVVSRHGYAYEHPNVEVREDLIEVIQEYKKKQEDLYICGGASIYKQALPYVDEILLSRIPGEYEGETYFVPFEHEFTCLEVRSFETFKLEIYGRLKC